jgi:Flp pilus assembly protein TadD
MTPGKALPGADQYDELTLGKRAFRAGNYGLAETHFRRAAEQSVNDAEAWLGLAASYDRLKRFDLADRAYKNLVRLTGETPEVLNNIGYSYILRGDYANARAKLAKALAMDPNNPYVQTNIAVLEKSIANRKGVR